ncbi:beta galactosidase jelly roll domain-containing protein [candidate division KSB1 bacterium]|nr:beta galactosidase jelly roll domain-containing protein [candidate division KSB1 bacterium]
MLRIELMLSLCIMFFFILILLGTIKAEMPSIPKPEHPRPDFQRNQWYNLNGSWDFELDPENVGLEGLWYQAGGHRFSKQIAVPFPWESALSGIEDVEYRGAAWYRRDFDVPTDWKGKRVFIKFGAVDWEANVWLNGQKIGDHIGGYSAFEFDITDFVDMEGKNTLTVRAFDETDHETPVGKQVGWYTRTSGIWQTVYLEARAFTYVESIRFYPDIDNSRIKAQVIIHAAKPGDVVIRLKSTENEFQEMAQHITLEKGRNTVVIAGTIAEPKLWSPEQPHLYFVRLILEQNSQEQDVIHSYFGMRKIHRAKYGDNSYEYIFLNNQPIYLRGALNQAFNPEGIYTYPDDEYQRRDLERAREFGLNFLRIHIKVDEPRFYYWADKLGVLIMSDMPNFARYSDRARANWELTFRDAVARDFNHPCIFSWCLFNETWGLKNPGEYSIERQEWVREMVALARTLDPTRLIEDNSPCFYDHVDTDINSWHFYIDSYWRTKDHINWIVRNAYPGSHHNYTGENRQTTAPLINSEYGGISAGHGDQDISWCLKYLTNELRLHQKICGYIYTELQDIEWEHNGMMNYDRQPKTFGYEQLMPGFTCRDIHNADFIAIDKEPCSRYLPGEEFSAEIFSNHFSSRQIKTATMHWKCTGYDKLGDFRKWREGSTRIPFKPYTVEKVHTLTFKLPNELFSGTVAVWVEDENREVVARNYVNVFVYDQPTEPVEYLSNQAALLRFKPGDYADAQWDELIHPPESRGEKVSGLGSGYFEYHLQLPEQIAADRVNRVELLFEGAARGGHAKVDSRFPNAHWSRKKPFDYPQTDVTKFPTDITIALNDEEIQTVHFEDDPADARGVLSHALEFEPGSYGYLTKIVIPQNILNALKLKWKKDRRICIRFSVKADAKDRGGFGLFGELAGQFPVKPTLLVGYQ